MRALCNACGMNYGTAIEKFFGNEEVNLDLLADLHDQHQLKRTICLTGKGKMRRTIVQTIKSIFKIRSKTGNEAQEKRKYSQTKFGLEIEYEQRNR